MIGGALVSITGAVGGAVIGGPTGAMIGGADSRSV